MESNIKGVPLALILLVLLIVVPLGALQVVSIRGMAALEAQVEAMRQETRKKPVVVTPTPELSPSVSVSPTPVRKPVVPSAATPSGQ